MEPGEEIIACVQEHGIVLLKPLFLFFLGWFVSGILLSLSVFLKDFFTYSNSIIIGAIFFILTLTHHFVFFFFIEYLISNLIITNKRLIDIKFFPFWEDDVSYIEIESIHEIEKTKHGIVKNFLNYGNIKMTVNGRPIVLQYTKYPSRLINLIEAIKFKKDLTDVHVAKTNISCPDKYKFLVKK